MKSEKYVNSKYYLNKYYKIFLHCIFHIQAFLHHKYYDHAIQINDLYLLNKILEKFLTNPVQSFQVPYYQIILNDQIYVLHEYQQQYHLQYQKLLIKLRLHFFYQYRGRVNNSSIVLGTRPLKSSTIFVAHAFMFFALFL